MTTYQFDREPFVYAIGWTDLDVWYLGVRYRKGCSPTDLWTTYFTSSKFVAEFRKEHGEPDHIEVLLTASREQVLTIEEEALREHKLYKDDRWLNRAAGGKAFSNKPGIKRSAEYCAKHRKPKSAETRAKMSAAKRAGPNPRANLGQAEIAAALNSQDGHRDVGRRFGVTGEAIRQLRVRHGWIRD